MGGPAGTDGRTRGPIAGVSTAVTAFVGSCGQGPLDAPQRLFAWSDYERLFGGLDGGELGQAVWAFYASGGRDSWVVRTAGPDADPAASTAIEALERAEPVNLLSLPDLRSLDEEAYRRAAAAAAAWCRKQRSFLLLDPPARLTTVAAAEEWAEAFPAALDPDSRSHVAAYWPEPLVPDPLAGGALRAIGPGALIAGLFELIDSRRGVWKAPAGVDAPLLAAVRLSLILSDAENGRINALGLNGLRELPTVGPIVFGARTLAAADGTDAEWKYVPVRRLGLYIENSLRDGLRWTVFEPNGEPFWSAIRSDASAFMGTLFRQGAFAGRTPDEAWRVACDATTTSSADVDAGVVNLVILFAPLRPSEFVILSIRLLAG
jgi:Bacteriophage tail sheath protein